MRKYIKKQILQILNTLFDAHLEIKNMCTNNKLDQAYGLLSLCQECAITIGEKIEESEGDSHITVSYLEEYCEAVYQAGVKIKDASDMEVLNKLLESIESSINKDISIKYEILFLPYKSSMWDSLESIWMASNNEKNCDCYVMPIPYYDKDPEGGFLEMHYEGNNFPAYVPITFYEEYNIQERHPDIIYFHNPYDQYNHVTSVHPIFYSSELKNHTDILVFVPYFIAGNSFETYEDAKKELYHVTPGVINSTYVVAQSEVWAKAVASSGISISKFLILGSPKIDAMISEIKKERGFPSEWNDKIKNKTVFLINTSIASILANANRINTVKKIMMTILQNQDCTFIWRPHPLLKTTIASLRPKYIPLYDDLVNFVEQDERVIYDDLPDMYVSVKYSDALISDMSSLVKTYILTEKPVLDIIEKDTPKKLKTTDWWGVYHFFDGVSIQEFIDITRNKNDYKKQERTDRFLSSITNPDGTCGNKVHSLILQKLSSE